MEAGGFESQSVKGRLFSRCSGATVAGTPLLINGLAPFGLVQVGGHGLWLTWMSAVAPPLRRFSTCTSHPRASSSSQPRQRLGRAGQSLTTNNRGADSGPFLLSFLIGEQVGRGPAVAGVVVVRPAGLTRSARSLTLGEDEEARARSGSSVDLSHLLCPRVSRVRRARSGARARG